MAGVKGVYGQQGVKKKREERSKPCQECGKEDGKEG